ncbi:hypothetical protein HBE96_17385 [Clostridium sp. P21]|uniref:Uncharacterized protein n=1 Tax=Clostridium muellerianum TaxID=2716538 RepID=A0A7Y0HQQ3_9CLOT|nr:hypothetical protein [Clostridium muellerianum]NMM64396.1 hypothetical protein [Clostridium muellerianum]
MFYNATVDIYNLPTDLKSIGLVDGDLQEYDKQIKIEEFVFCISKRFYCEYTNLITKKSFLKIDNEFYKCIKPKNYGGCMEIMLYKCQS